MNERFSDGVRVGKEDNQPIVLLIDELDLLLTRNQSVIFMFQWKFIIKKYTLLIVLFSTFLWHILLCRVLVRVCLLIHELVSSGAV